MQLSMQFGELSDDFYKYCRRWTRNTDQYVKSVVREIETGKRDESERQPKPFSLSFNFKQFTRIMMMVHQRDIIPI